MPITIGIYDFFSYTVPGLIYLLVVYAGLNLVRPISVEFGKFSDATIWGSLILLVFFSFLVGHVFDSISHRVWYRVFYRGGSQERAYNQFTKIVGVRASFNPHQWSVLLAAIRHNNAQLADAIDRNKATSVMLRNISFALFLLGLVFAVQTFISLGSWYVFAPLSIVVFIGSGISLRRSDHFNMAFYHMIYIQALMYGDSMEKVIEANRDINRNTSVKKTVAQKRSGKSRK